ncbi:MAG: RsmD family RNA methyltransferase [Kiritimatiellia bacterium]|jgi:16S rRNA (guanine966-N2)-methyltransferase
MAIRITAGEWRGRQIKVPRGDVRPAQDRVRLAVFSSLADRVPGARVLDLFAGTGAYGLEALSRGAASVTWVENDHRVLEVLRENVESLCAPDIIGRLQVGVDAVRRNREGPFSRTAATPEYPGLMHGRSAVVVSADALRFLERGGGGAPYDLIFADPPYDRDGGWLKKILSALTGRSILKSSGLLVMEQSVHVPAVTRAGWQQLKRRVYGETQIDYMAALPPEVRSQRSEVRDPNAVADQESG